MEKVTAFTFGSLAGLISILAINKIRLSLCEADEDGIDGLDGEESSEESRSDESRERGSGWGRGSEEGGGGGGIGGEEIFEKLYMVANEEMIESGADLKISNTGLSNVCFKYQIKYLVDKLVNDNCYYNIYTLDVKKLIKDNFSIFLNMDEKLDQIWPKLYPPLDQVPAEISFKYIFGVHPQRKN